MKDLVDRRMVGMTTMCAWHSIFFPEEGQYQISGKPFSVALLNGEPVSHGICKRCKPKFIAESRGRI